MQRDVDDAASSVGNDDDDDDDELGWDSDPGVDADSWLAEEVGHSPDSNDCRVQLSVGNTVCLRLNLLSTRLEQRAADTLGLRLEVPLSVSVSLDGPRRPSPLVPLRVECSQEATPEERHWNATGHKPVAPYGLRAYVPGLVHDFFTRRAPSLGPEPGTLLPALGHELLGALGEACGRCAVCYQPLLGETTAPAAAGGPPAVHREASAASFRALGIRMRPCQKDACMFKWEETEHFGTCLAELRACPAATAVDLCLASQAAASASSAKVFEPFPSFMLKEQQMRARAGQFDSGIEKAPVAASTSVAGAYGASTSVAGASSAAAAFAPGGASAEAGARNKRLRTLAFLLRLLPPVEAMGEARSEAALQILLDRTWSETMADAALSREWEAIAKDEGWPESFWRTAPAATANEPATEATDDLDPVLLNRSGAHGLLYRTLRFVLLSNRLVLHEMRGELRFAQMPAKLHFTILQVNPERERRFQERRAQHGSFFAFHGAPTDCWFSILRNSLRSLSGSSMQRHGAALGAGIYLAERSGYSLSYARGTAASAATAAVRTEPVAPERSQTLALVECIDRPEYLKSGAPAAPASGHYSAAANRQGRVWVVPNDEDVVVRFLFVGVGHRDDGSVTPAPALHHPGGGTYDVLAGELDAVATLERVAAAAIAENSEQRKRLCEMAEKEAEERERAERAADDDKSPSPASASAPTTPSQRDVAKPRSARRQSSEERELAMAMALSLAESGRDTKRPRLEGSDDGDEEDGSGGCGSGGGGDDDDDDYDQDGDDDDDDDDDGDDFLGDAIAEDEPLADGDAADAALDDASIDVPESIRLGITSDAGAASRGGGAASSALAGSSSGGGGGGGGGGIGGGGNAAATKLIAQEFMRLARLRGKGASEGVSVFLPDESDVYRWACAMRPPVGSPLHDELVAFGQKHPNALGDGEPAIQMELLFTGGFPNEPPFIRVVSPRFARHSGHITLGGSICTELLTSSGWSPAYTLEAVLVDIRATIVTGGGRLDEHRAHVPYDLREARESFNFVARQHKWI